VRRGASRAAVVCVGNELMADDGVGPAVHRRLLAAPLPRGSRLHLVGTCGLDLLEVLDGEELLIVVDALTLGAPPGTLHLLAETDLPRGRGMGTHAGDLAGTLAAGRRLDPDRVPARVLILGFEGAVFDRVGESMSPAVSARIDELVAAIWGHLE